MMNMFTVTFPVDTGTYVIRDHKGVDLTDPKNLVGRLGVLTCYADVTEYNMRPNNFAVQVSGWYNSAHSAAWCGKYELDDLLVATSEQVEMYRKELEVQ